MNKSQNLQVGSTLILTGGFLTRKRNEIPREVIVKKIGRDYIYIADQPDKPEKQWIKFRKHDWLFIGDNNYHYHLYESMEEFTHWCETKQKRQALFEFFTFPNIQKLPNDIIDEIYEILKKNGSVT